MLDHRVEISTTRAGSLNPSTSWSGLSRPSTVSGAAGCAVVDARDEPGHDDAEDAVGRFRPGRAPDLLHVIASPRGERSRSLQVAEEYLRGIQRARPTVHVDTLNLWQAQLPAFDGAMLEAKYAVLAKTPHTPEQAAAWAEIGRFWRQLDTANAVLFSLPMWNRSVPYILKQYIDIITQPGLAFSFTPGVGYTGLARPKPVTVVYASASDYAPGMPLEAADFQKPYFEHWLGFIGITDIRRIVVAPTMGASDQVEAAMARALNDAEHLAAEAVIAS